MTPSTPCIALASSPRRRVYVNAAVLLTFFSLMALVSFSFWTASPTPSRATEPSHDSSNLDALQPDVLDPRIMCWGHPLSTSEVSFAVFSLTASLMLSR